METIQHFHSIQDLLFDWPKRPKHLKMKDLLILQIGAKKPIALLKQAGAVATLLAKEVVTPEGDRLKFHIAFLTNEVKPRYLEK